MPGGAGGRAGHTGGPWWWDQDGFPGRAGAVLISLSAQLASWGAAAGEMEGTPSGADSSRLALAGGHTWGVRGQDGVGMQPPSQLCLISGVSAACCTSQALRPQGRSPGGAAGGVR